MGCCCNFNLTGSLGTDWGLVRRNNGMLDLELVLLCKLMEWRVEL